jgi:hypothetical protein
MPRLQDAIPGLARRAWQGRSNPLLLTPLHLAPESRQLVRDGFIRVIITTNFDRLMENSLREIGVEPTVVKSDDDLKGAVPLVHSQCYLVKVHGDYLDTRIRNTEVELAAYSPALNTLLDRIIDEHGLIVCGWSADWDTALRAAIERAPSRRYPVYLTASGTISGIASDIIRQRSAKVIQISDADAFFKSLVQMVTAQINLKRTNPNSIELLIARVKDYLSKHEHRIVLDELLGEESHRVHSAINAESYSVVGQWSDERFTGTVSQYEAIVEPLARIFGVLGRWGDGEEFDTVSDIITHYASSLPTSGNLMLIRLRAYPAVIMLYSYGSGLVKARRYRHLFRLFSSPIRYEIDNVLCFATGLVAGAWQGGDDKIWSLLPGLDGKLTPLSNHLHDVLTLHMSDYSYMPNEPTLVFEEFEVLGALAFLTITADESALEQSRKPDQYGRNFVHPPVGRVSWDRANRDKIFQAFSDEENATAIIGAGFARDSRSYFSEALANLDRLYNRVRWLS